MNHLKADFNKIEYAKRIKNREIDIAQYYTNPPESEIKKAGLTVQYLLSKESEKVLDLGCSLGFYSFSLINNHNLVIGLDYEWNSLLIAKKHSFKIANEYCRMPTFLNADAIHLPFKDQIFDKINSIDFIEHIIPQYQTKVIKEISRILRKNGKVNCYTPNYTRVRLEYYINKIKYALKGRYFLWQEDRPYKDKPNLPNHQDTLLHVGLLNFKKLQKLFLEENFKIYKIFYNEYSIPFISKLINLIISKMNIKQPLFYGIFCSNIHIIFKKK